MHRAESPSGLFDAGNPAPGQDPTQITYEWLNDMQEQVVQVILDAGIALEPGNPLQLAQAIDTLISGFIGIDLSGGTSLVPGRTVTGGGLLQGGGDMSANRVLTLPKASAADAVAATRDDAALTPLALADVIGSHIFDSWEASIDRRFQSAMLLRLGRLIIQSFVIDTVPNDGTPGPQLVTLLETFPTAAIAGFAQPRYPRSFTLDGLGHWDVKAAQVINLSPSTITYRTTWQSVQSVQLIIIGY